MPCMRAESSGAARAVCAIYNARLDPSPTPSKWATLVDISLQGVRIVQPSLGPQWPIVECVLQIMMHVKGLDLDRISEKVASFTT